MLPYQNALILERMRSADRTENFRVYNVPSMDMFHPRV